MCCCSRRRIARALEKIDATLGRVASSLEELVQQNRAVRLKLKFQLLNENDEPIGTEVDDVMAVFQMTDVQKVDASIQSVDAKGFAAQVEPGSVAWASSDPTILTVTQDPTDQLKASVVAVKPGTAQVQVSADADLGAGVVTINGIADVEVLAGQATALAVNLGTPTDQ